MAGKHYELTIPICLTVLENVVFDEHTREVDFCEKLVTGVLFCSNFYWIFFICIKWTSEDLFSFLVFQNLKWFRKHEGGISYRIHPECQDAMCWPSPQECDITCM